MCGCSCRQAHWLETGSGYICECVLASVDCANVTCDSRRGHSVSPFNDDFLRPSEEERAMDKLAPVNTSLSLKLSHSLRQFPPDSSHMPSGSGSNSHIKGEKIATREVEISPVPDS